LAYDGSIRINTRIDGKGFDTGVKGMMSSLGRLAATIGAVFGVQQIVNFGKEGVKTAMQMEAGWQGLSYMANAYGRDIGHISDFLKEFTEDGLVPMMNAQQAYKNMLARGYDTDQLEQMLLVMKDSAVYLRKGQLDIGDAIEKTTMGLRTERSILTDSSGIEQNMYKMWQAYAKEIGATISSLTQEQKMLAEYYGFMREGAVYAGAAAEYTQTYAGRVAQLTAAMIDLKVSVGNMLIPILNQLLPKIIELVRWFTNLFNIVGRVMNLLFGTKVGAVDTQPIEDGAEAYGELGDAAEEAGKAAKGALAPFDKLNVLAQPKAAGGGGGGGEVLPIEPADTTPFEEELDELGVKIDAFKLKLIGLFDMFKTGDLSTLGETVSNWILGALGSAREAIQGFDFKQLGAGIGTGFNTVISSVQSFIANIDYGEIGKQAGGLLSDIFTGMLDTGIGFLQEVDWQNIGTTIWEGVKGAFEFAWGFLSGVDWSEVVSSVFELLGSAFGAVAGAVVGLGTAIWESLKEAWNTTKERWSEFKDEAGGDIWGGVKEGIINALHAIDVWLLEKVVKPFIDGFKKAFGISSPSTVMAEQGVNIIDGLKQGIEDAWNAAKTWFDDKVIAPLKEWFSEAWEDIKGFASDAWTKIEEIWTTSSTWFNDNVTEPIKTFFSEAWDAISGKVTGVWDDIKLAWQDASTWFDDTIWTPISTKAGEIWDTIKSGAINIGVNIANGIVSAVNGVIGFINTMIDGLESAINSLINLVNRLPLINIPNIDLPNIGLLDEIPQQTLTIPALATGTVIPANAPFAAILGDQRSGTNIEAPLKTIEQAVDNVLARRGINAGADNGLIHNVIKLDGQVLYDAFKKIDKRVGRSLIAGSGIR